uniref:OCIA domain-containing protein n=1 Tax=Callorhinchus milii TaxID=7868 RepID=A0A4W3IDA4_CALMI
MATHSPARDQGDLSKYPYILLHHNASHAGVITDEEGWCGGHHAHSDEIKKIIIECKRESFWYRAVPLSLGSMLLTQGLLYKGILSPSKRFGSIPKVALAGILGFAIGKISYVGACRKKFQGAGFHPFGDGFPQGFRNFPFQQPPHVCKECKGRHGHGDPAGVHHYNKSHQPSPAEPSSKDV